MRYVPHPDYVQWVNEWTAIQVFTWLAVMVTVYYYYLR